jgi:son of sevenless-like protein
LSSDKEVEKDKVQRNLIEPEGQVINIGHQPSGGTPWHLRRQYADQVDTDDKGNVLSGSLLSLLEMLTFPPTATGELDDAQAIHASGTEESAELARYKAFTNVFLMTFRTFTTADHFFDLLVERFHFKPYELLTDSEYLDWKANLRISVQSLVLEIFRRWLENHHLLEEEPHIAQRLKDFLTRIVSPHDKTAAIIIRTIDHMVRWVIGLWILSD